VEGERLRGQSVGVIRLEHQALLLQQGVEFTQLPELLGTRRIVDLIRRSTG
jgi:hypothetical protein